MLEIVDEKLEAGAVVGGRYRLEHVLGEGGMGVVWSAQELASSRRVALKFMRESEKTDPKNHERFLREARAAMTIAHPNVARVEAAMETRGGVPYIVMEYLEGVSLRDELRKRRVLGVGECAKIVVAIVDAISAAHEKRIVHRDLKPENVFLLAQGGVRVLDFGIAKQLPRETLETASQSLTATGALLGTPLYMAPEQLFGDEVDLRVDVWALGIMTYECLAGEPPTAGNGFGPVIKRITTEPLVPLEHVRAGLPVTLTAMVARMLSRDRDARPSLAEIRAVFAVATSSTDAPPSPLAMSYATNPTPQRPAVYPVGYSQGSQAPAMRPSPVAPTLDPLPTGPNPYVHTPPPVAKKSAAPWIVGAALAVVVVASAGALGWARLRGGQAAPAPVPTMSVTWGSYLTEAAAALARRDGATCLRALDAADGMLPPGEAKSSDPKSMNGQTRSMCLMLAGECEKGKEVMIAWWQTNYQSMQSRESLVDQAEGQATQYCEGDKLAPRDELLRANYQLEQIGKNGRAVNVADCHRLHDTEKRLLAIVPPRSAIDTVALMPPGVEAQLGVCLARAGQCDEGWKVYHDDFISHHQDYLPKDREPGAKTAFNNAVQGTKCTR